MQLEHDSMGFYFSSHPLQQLDWLGRLLHVQQACCTTGTAGQCVRVPAGNAANVRKHTTRQGGSMCFLTCEDRTGTADCVVFPNLYPDVRPKLKRQATLWIRGKITQKEERVSVRCESILTTEEIRQLFPQSDCASSCRQQHGMLSKKLLHSLRNFQGKFRFAFT